MSGIDNRCIDLCGQNRTCHYVTEDSFVNVQPPGNGLRDEIFFGNDPDDIVALPDHYTTDAPLGHLPCSIGDVLLSGSGQNVHVHNASECHPAVPGR